MIPKLYFYSDGIENHGPFTIEELKGKQITEKTLIWFEGETEWRQLSFFSDLLEQLKPHLKDTYKTSEPPPLPKQQVVNTNMSSGKGLQIVFISIWTTIHLFALLMSYTGVKFFNAEGPPEKEQFWPFVQFTERVEYTKFNHGIFYQYDWTEFAFYVGIVWVIYFIYRMAKRKAKTQ